MILQTIARNAFWNALGTSGGIALGVVTSTVIARSLGPADTGVYAYALWLIGVVVTLINLSLPKAAARFGAEFLARGDSSGAWALLQRVAMCELGLGTLATVAMSLGAWWWASPELRLPLAVAGMVVVPAALANVFQSAVYGAQDYRAANRVALLLSAGQLVLVLAMVRLGWDVPGLVGAVLVRQLAYASFLACHVRQLYPDRPPRAALAAAQRRQVLAYIRDTTMALLIALVVWDRSEVFFLRHYASSEQIAFYVLAYEYAAKAMSVPRMFSGVLMPSVSTLYGRGDGRSIGRIFVGGSRLIGLIALPIGVGGAALAPTFVQLVLGSEYRPVGWLLSALLVCNVFGAVSAVSAAVAYGVYDANDRFLIVKVGLATMVLNLGLDVLLIPRWAAVGAVVANSVSQITASVIGCVYIASRLGTGFPLAALGQATVAAVGCGILAYGVTLVVPGWLGLVLALFLLSGAYVLFLAWTHALAPEDLSTLGRLADWLPRPVAHPYRRALGWWGRS